jgi:hypothetical protein
MRFGRPAPYKAPMRYLLSDRQQMDQGGHEPPGGPTGAARVLVGADGLLRKTGVGEPPPDPSIADALEQRLLRIGSEVEHTLVQRERRELPVQDARTRRVSPRARLGFGPGLATPRLSTSGARLRLAGMPLTDSCHRTS